MCTYVHVCKCVCIRMCGCMRVCSHLSQSSFLFRTRCPFTGRVSTLTDFWSLWAQLYSGSFIVRHHTCMMTAFLNYQCYFKQFLFLLALRGASSKRKKGSLYAGKSASQEALSPPREERKEEKKAQSLGNLDGNCEPKMKLFISWHEQRFCNFSREF